MNSSHPIKDYMTPLPLTIGEGIPLAKAVEIMRDHHVRHLPVLSKAKTVGIISGRDISRALAFFPDAKNLKVGDLMTEDPYMVMEGCPLQQVVSEMAQHKYGCAIVENEQGRAIGIFTAVDAMRLFGEWLEMAEGSPSPVRTASK